LRLFISQVIRASDEKNLIASCLCTRCASVRRCLWLACLQTHSRRKCDSS